MKIGTLATRSGRSVHTIRYYEKLRLMPNVSRDAGGRREYTERHVSWLDFLARLRASGMSIADMQAYTALVVRGDATLAQRQAFLRAHRRRVVAAVRDLEQCLAMIDYKIGLYGRWIKAGGSPHQRSEGRTQREASAAPSHASRQPTGWRGSARSRRDSR